jgi:Flp pilus assembly protein TadG
MKGVAMRKRRKNDHGAAALEFALVLPILIVVVFGIIDYGVVFAQNLALSNAARQAARFGAVEGRTCSQIISEATGTISGEMIAYKSSNLTTPAVTRGGACTGATKPCTGSSGDSVKVTINYQADFLLPMPIPGFPSSKNLVGKGEFKCEFS